MVKIADEEFNEIESEKRHQDLISSLKALVPKPDPTVPKLLGEAVSILNVIAKKDLSVDLKPVVKELSQGVEKLTKALEPRSMSFKIERNKLGLIERIVLEK